MIREAQDPQKIGQVFLWQNGMVMTFSQTGDQMADYQGQLPQVREAILRDAPETAVFRRDWRGDQNRISRDEFRKAAFTPQADLN